MSAQVETSSEGGVEGVQTYRARWLMLALFSLASASNAILWITFSPVNSVTQTYYGIDAEKVNALSIVFLAAYVPVSFVTNWIFNRFGVRFGINLACVLNALAGLLRFLSAESNDAARSHGFEIVLIGQTIGAIAQPFLTNMPARIGSTWFPTTERDLAVALGSLSNPIGIAVGSVLPTLFVENNLKIYMYDLLLVELIIMSVVALLVVVLFKEKPALPPSLSESTKNALTLKEEFALVFKNKQFLILLVCFGTGLGFFNALTTLVEQLLSKSNYTTDDAGLFSGLLLGCGVIAAIIVGILMDRVHKYNVFLKVGFGLAGIFIVIFVLMIRADNSDALAALFALMGASMLPMLPVAFECAVECTYPVSEDLTTGLLMSAGQITGIILIVVLGALIENQPVYTTYTFEPAYILIVVFSLIFAVGVQFYQGEYRRLHAENEEVQNLSP